MSLLLNPVFETLINKAVFINQDILVYPRDTPLPKNITEVVKFLFGEGTHLEQDVVNGSAVLKITGATYVLSGAKTLNADWTYKEIKQEEREIKSD